MLILEKVKMSVAGGSGVAEGGGMGVGRVMGFTVQVKRVISFIRLATCSFLTNSGSEPCS